MSQIQLLDKHTIDKIAAGEVVDRPASVVKELMENAIDAKATAITVEIKDGGTAMIRITDNGSGIPKDQVKMAFLRHSTSKITKVEDLLTIASLGFRGEALSSISAVSQLELITKIPDQLTGVRYCIEGGTEISMEDIGAPNGTTFIVRNLFYNTPARKKFLKTNQTEAGYVNDLVERMALATPSVSVKFINNGQVRLNTSGNGQLKDIIYQVYGRDIAANLLEVQVEKEHLQVQGYVGKPVISRGNRNYENYFVNGRYVKSALLSRCIEDSYRGFMMQHKYPFTMLQISVPGHLVDVNVHPAKMELRFSESEEIYAELTHAIVSALKGKELIPQVSVGAEKKETVKQMQPVEKRASLPEPFETKRLEKIRQEIRRDSPYEPKYDREDLKRPETVREATAYRAESQQITLQESVLASGKLLDPASKKEHKIIGQLFDTYWLVEFRDSFYMIDQHAAHEKVLYEQTMASYHDKSFTTQYVSPPIILSLTMQEENLLKKYLDNFTRIGFEIEPFGGKEYAVRGVPANLYGLDGQTLMLEMLDSLGTLTGKEAPELVTERVASLSCKAAVKGNHHMSYKEIEALIDELLTLENPYHCPHGRPVIVAMSKQEIEKKFKRIL